MKKILKKDISIFTVVFLLCGTILILGTSILLSNFQYKNNTEDLISENGKLVAEKITYEGKIEMLESERDIQETFKDIAIDDVETLRAYYNDLVWPYMNKFEDMTIEYDSLVVDIYNEFSWIMSDFQETKYKNTLSGLQDTWGVLGDNLSEDIEDWTENNVMFY